jgi:hypothetical protein
VDDIYKSVFQRIAEHGRPVPPPPQPLPVTSPAIG